MGDIFWDLENFWRRIDDPFVWLSNETKLLSLDTCRRIKPSSFCVPVFWYDRASGASKIISLEYIHIDNIDIDQYFYDTDANSIYYFSPSSLTCDSKRNRQLGVAQSGNGFPHFPWGNSRSACIRLTLSTRVTDWGRCNKYCFESPFSNQTALVLLQIFRFWWNQILIYLYRLPFTFKGTSVKPLLADLWIRISSSYFLSFPLTRK